MATREFAVPLGVQVATPGDRRSYVATLVLIGTVAALVMSISPLIVDGLVTAAHLTLSEAGYCASLETVGVCLGTAAALFMERRTSPRAIMAIGLIGMVIGNLLSAKAAGFLGFAMVRFATGASCGLTMIFSGLLAQTMRPQRNFAIYMGVNVVSVALIGMIVPSLVAWKGVAGIYGAIALFGLLCLVNIKALSDRPERDTRTTATGVDRARPVRGVVAGCIIQIMFTYGLSMIWTYLAAFGNRRGVGADTLSFVIAISWLLAGAGGSLAAGLLDGKVASRKLVAISGLAFILTVALLWYGAGEVATYVSVASFIFWWSFVFPPIMNVMAELDPLGQFATIGMLLQTAGFAIGPATAALILRHISLGPVAVAAVIAFVGMIVALRFLGRPADEFHLVIPKTAGVA